MPQLVGAQANHVEPWRRALRNWGTLAMLALWISVSSVLTSELLSEYRLCPGHLSFVERSEVPKDWLAATPIYQPAGEMLGPFHVGLAYPWGKSASLRVLIADRDLCPMDHLDISVAFAQAQSRYLPPSAFAQPDHLRLRRLTVSGPFVVSLANPSGASEEFVAAFRRVNQPVRMFADRSAQLRARRGFLAHGAATALLLLGVALFRVGVSRPGTLRILATLLGIGLVGASLLLSVGLVS